MSMTNTHIAYTYGKELSKVRMDFAKVKNTRKI